MAVFGNAVLTESGKNLMYDIIANEGTIEFTRIVIGKGEYTASEKMPGNLKNLTSLKAAEQSYDISLIKKESDFYVRLGTLMTNYDPDTRDPITTENFYLNEMGIMAKEAGTNTEVLYGITVCATEKGDYIPIYNGNNPIEIMQDFSVFVSTDVNVSLEYPETAYARADDVSDAIDETVDYVDENVKVLKEIIATVEETSAASKAYDIGEHLIYDGMLYSVKAQIPEGGALTVGTNIEQTTVGEELESLKKSVSDGKTLVAGAITDMNVPTATDASFQTMAQNIGDILDANPGSVSSDVELSRVLDVDFQYTNQVDIKPSMTLNAGYITQKGTERTKRVSLSASGNTVYLKDTDNTNMARQPVSSGRVTATVSTEAGTSSTVSVAPNMTLTAGYIASKGTETAKSLTLANNGANVDLKDGSTVIGRVAKTAGSVTATVSTTAGTSSTVSVSPNMSLSAGHISSKGTETAKTLTLANNGANVDLKDGNTVIGRVAKTTGSVTSSASFNSGTSTTVTAKSAMSLTAGHISSKGTEGTATAYLVRSGNYVYLSSKSDRGSGNVDYGRYSIPTQTKTASPTTSDVTVSPDSGYLLSGVTAKAPHQLRDYFYAGTLSSGSHAYYDDEGNQKTTGTHIYMAYGTSGYTKAAHYIGRPASDFGDASAANVVSGKKFTSSAGLKVTGTFEGQTKTSAYPSVNTTRSVSPDSGKYLSGVTVPQFRNATMDPWATTSSSNTRYSINSGTGSANSGDAMRLQLTGSQAMYFNNPFYASETGDLLMLFLAISGRTAGAISIGIHNSTTKPSSVTGFKVYTQLTMSSFTGYILVPCLSSYTAGQINSGGKIWYVPSAWSANDSAQYIHVFCDAAIGVSGAFNGTCNIYGCGARIK